MGSYRFARALHSRQSKLIDKEVHKSRTEAVKIRKFHNNIPDAIKKSINTQLTDYVTCNDIFSKSEECVAAHRVANTEHNNQGYSSKEYNHSNATSARSSFHTPQPRLRKCQ